MYWEEVSRTIKPRNWYSLKLLFKYEVVLKPSQASKPSACHKNTHTEVSILLSTSIREEEIPGNSVRCMWGDSDEIS